MAMYVVRFEATPKQSNAADFDCGGAFINCYIERSTRAEAIDAARAAIIENGWIAGEPDDVDEVDDSTFRVGSPDRAYYEQAKIDKEVFVYHTYPVVDEEK